MMLFSSSANIQTLTILKDNKDHTYTREEMIDDGFKIQSSDLIKSDEGGVLV